MLENLAEFSFTLINIMALILLPILAFGVFLATIYITLDIFGLTTKIIKSKFLKRNK